MFTLNDQPINIYNPITIEGVTYIYAAFAESPFKYALAR